MTDYHVSTDCPEIEKVAIQYGSNVLHRPKSLATDETTSGAVLHYSLQAMEKAGQTFDAVVCLHPTSPCREAWHIDEAIELFERNYNATLLPLASVVRLPEKSHPNINVSFGDTAKWVNGGYMMNGAIYIVPTYLLKQHRKHAYEFGVIYVMDQRSSIDIDTPLDWQIAEALCEDPHNDSGRTDLQ